MRPLAGKAANNVLPDVPLAELTISRSFGTAGKMHGSTFRFMRSAGFRPGPEMESAETHGMGERPSVYVAVFWLIL